VKFVHAPSERLDGVAVNEVIDKGVPAADTTKELRVEVPFPPLESDTFTVTL
jgi:hypothetical protein